MSILRGLLIAAVVSGAAGAQGRGNAKKSTAVVRTPAGVSVVRVKYNDNDRNSDARVITGWYNDHPDQRWGGNGRGRARGHAIAPGWQKKLVRNQVIPVTYRTYVVPAPRALVLLLPPVRSGWDFMVVENRVMLVDRPTWTIVDVIIP